MLLTTLFLTWLLIFTCLFFPRMFMIAGAVLYSLGEAVDGVKETFQLRFARHRRGLNADELMERIK